MAEPTLRVNRILAPSFLDGPGSRMAIFLQGCDLACEGGDFGDGGVDACFEGGVVCGEGLDGNFEIVDCGHDGSPAEE